MTKSQRFWNDNLQTAISNDKACILHIISDPKTGDLNLLPLGGVTIQLGEPPKIVFPKIVSSL